MKQTQIKIFPLIALQFSFMTYNSSEKTLWMNRRSKCVWVGSRRQRFIPTLLGIVIPQNVRWAAEGGWKIVGWGRTRIPFEVDDFRGLRLFGSALTGNGSRLPRYRARAPCPDSILRLSNTWLSLLHMLLYPEQKVFCSRPLLNNHFLLDKFWTKKNSITTVKWNILNAKI